jgi:hypothetical protein
MMVEGFASECEQELLVGQAFFVHSHMILEFY